MKKYNVPALEKTIAILEMISGSDQSYTITEFHTQLDLSKTTVFMILNVLESHNIVRKDDNGKYSLGPKLYEYGMSYMSKMEINKIAKPYMERLVQTTGHTSHLGIIVDNQVLFIEKVEKPSFIKFSTYTGLRSDVHISSLGKAMAAFLPETELDAIVQARGLGRYTPNTIVEPDKLKSNLENIRKLGYAIEDEEGEIGVRCIGAPIFDYSNKVVAAVSITALKSELTADLFPIVGEEVRSAARDISRDMGASMPVAL